eukprot:gene6795-7561_t
MIAMYILIYRTAAKTIRKRIRRMSKLTKNSKNKITTTRTELRVAHMFGLLLFFFILAYLPILWLNLMDLINQGHLISPVMEKISLYSLIVNSIVNPILCLLLKKDYQLIIKRWICCEWVMEKWRDNSIRSQLSEKTAMDNIDAHENSTDSMKKKSISNRHSTVRRLEQKEHSPRFSGGKKEPLTRMKSITFGTERQNSTKNGIHVKSDETEKTNGKQYDGKAKKPGKKSTFRSLSESSDIKPSWAIKHAESVDERDQLVQSEVSEGQLENNNSPKTIRKQQNPVEENATGELPQQAYQFTDNTMESIELLNDKCLFSKTHKTAKNTKDVR